jgi:hypothetical protein
MPLVSPGGGAGRGNQSEQQEQLPAWLESLRARERPVASGRGEDQPFSMAELVDENAMPSWMRLDQSKLNENSDAFPALPSTARPGPGSEKPFFPTNGFDASSLIDEESLPSWMRGQGNGQPGADQNLSANSLIQPESLPAWMREQQSAQPPAAQSMPASSLMQSELLPPWMKNLEPGGPSLSSGRQANEQYGLPAQMPASLPPASPPGTPWPPSTSPTPYNGPLQVPAPGFSAGELVDQQSLPDWMTGAQGPGQQSPSRPVPRGSGFSAGELIDQQSLPAWLKNQQGQGNPVPQSSIGMPGGGGSGQGAGTGQERPDGVGMSAANLLDMDSLPPWMREGEQSAGSTQGMMQPGGSGMVAGSLIDVNALPAWLRNADNAQQGSGVRGGQAQARVESTRVPSRPRGEVPPPEQSEMAANVFASMLGVAASAPTFSNQPQTNLGIPQTNLGVPQGQPVQPAQQMQSGIPGWQFPQQPAANQGAQTWQTSGAPTSPAPGPGALYPQSPTNNTEQPAYYYNPGAGQPDRAGPGSAAMGVGRSGEAQGESVKKKGFFDSIRDFFFK